MMMMMMMMMMMISGSFKNVHESIIIIIMFDDTLSPQVGSVVERNPKKCTALVNLGSDQIVSLDYDYLCEHVEQGQT